MGYHFFEKVFNGPGPQIFWIQKFRVGPLKFFKKMLKTSAPHCRSALFLHNFGISRAVESSLARSFWASVPQPSLRNSRFARSSEISLVRKFSTLPTYGSGQKFLTSLVISPSGFFLPVVFGSKVPKYHRLTSFGSVFLSFRDHKSFHCSFLICLHSFKSVQFRQFLPFPSGFKNRFGASCPNSKGKLRE